MSRIDMNRPIKLADELLDRLAEETDNAADLLAGVALAVRRMQGYSDYVLLSLNQSLQRVKTKEDE